MDEEVEVASSEFESAVCENLVEIESVDSLIEGASLPEVSVELRSTSGSDVLQGASCPGPTECALSVDLSAETPFGS